MSDQSEYVIRLNKEQFRLLLFSLGIAMASPSFDDPGNKRKCIDLVNQVGSAHPNFTPYELPEERSNQR
jgi:hypothetical protein